MKYSVLNLLRTTMGVMISFFSLASYGTTRECGADLTVAAFDSSYSLLKEFKRSCGLYPTTDEGLDALKKMPLNLKCKDLPKVDPELKFEDGWYQKFKYTSDGKKFRIEASHGYYLTDKTKKKNKKYRWENAKPIELCEDSMKPEKLPPEVMAQ